MADRCSARIDIGGTLNRVGLARLQQVLAEYDYVDREADLLALCNEHGVLRIEDDEVTNGIFAFEDDIAEIPGLVYVSYHHPLRDCPAGYHIVNNEYEQYFNAIDEDVAITLETLRTALAKGESLASLVARLTPPFLAPPALQLASDESDLLPP